MIYTILFFAAVLSSCGSSFFISGKISSAEDEDRNYFWLNENKLTGIRNISVINKAERIRLICKNNDELGSGRIFHIQSEGKSPPFALKLKRKKGTLVLQLKNETNTEEDGKEKIVELVLGSNYDIERFENITEASSTALQFNEAEIEQIEIDTSSGSNYLKLDNCVADSIIMNADYGRTYTVLNKVLIQSNFRITGSPDESKVLYYDKVSGAVHVDMFDCIFDSSIKINSVSGKIEIYAENTVFSAPVESVSAGGMHFYDLWDCKIKDDASFKAVSDSGKIYFKLAEHDRSGRDFDVNLYSGSEEVYFRMWGPLDIFRYDITTITKTGEKEFHSYEDFDTVENGSRYRSKNFEEPLELVTVKAETESGRIFTRVVDCYKKIRFCEDFKTMRPLAPPFEM